MNLNEKHLMAALTELTVTVERLAKRFEGRPFEIAVALTVLGISAARKGGCPEKTLKRLLATSSKLALALNRLGLQGMPDEVARVKMN